MTCTTEVTNLPGVLSVRNVSKIVILASTIVAANYFANPRSSIVVKPSFGDDALVITQVGERKVVIQNSGRVNWLRENSSEHILTLDSGILAHKENLDRIVRTLASVELSAPLEKYRAAHVESKPSVLAPEQAIIEYTISSFHAKLVVRVLGDGAITVSGRNWDGPISKEIGVLSSEQRLALQYFAQNFEAKPLVEIEPARKGISPSDAYSVEVMVFPGTAQAVPVYIEREDGSIWHGGISPDDSSRFLLVDFSRKLLEFEDFAPNSPHAVSSL
jgi:hypothetical protein